ncbi:MAG: Sorbitol dehydrogenase [candidate division BRC1 bacterium ADurb.BinA364]|nr:MAG: Sorbitol dehydrogenase [candidate division BRC1 bacterium ADurb.BinA364]
MAAALRTFEVMPLEGEARFGSPAGGRPWIAVLGVGRLGLLIAAVAQALGARVIGLARTERSLERAAAYCEALVRADDEERAIRQVKTRTEGLGADIVVEATGSPAGLPLACRLVRPRGSVALKSTPGLPADGLNPTQLAVDEIRLQGSRCGPFDKAIRFLAEKRLDCEALATAVFPLAQAEQAILAAMHEPKALIRCRS